MSQKNQKLLTICLFVLTMFFSIKLFDELIYLIKYVFKLLFPILLGFAIAFILNPLKRKIMKHKISNGVSTAISIIVFTIILSLILIVIIPGITHELKEFFGNFNMYTHVLEELYTRITNKIVIKYDIKEYINKFLSNTLSGITLKIVSVFQTIISYAILVFISIFIAIYILYDFDKMTIWIKEKSTKFMHNKLFNFLTEFKDVMYSYLKSLLQLNFIMFLLASLLFWIIGLDYILVIALIFAITNIIPYLGPYIGGSFAVIIGLNNSPRIAIYAFFVIILLQFLDNYIISPKIQGSNTDIKSIWIIISVVIMGSLFGIVGMFLAIPMASLIQLFIKFYVVKQEN